MTGWRLSLCATLLATVSAGALVFIAGAFVQQTWDWIPLVGASDRIGALVLFVILWFLFQLMYLDNLEKDNG